MICPYCGKEMDLGYIQCRDGVCWTPKKRSIEAFTYLSKGKVSLANGAADNVRTVFAYNCSVCRKVIVDYSDDNKPVQQKRHDSNEWM